MNSLLYPWGKKALTFSLKSTRLIQTPHYYGQFAVSLGKKALTFSLKSTRFIRTHPVKTDTLYDPLSALIRGFDCSSIF